MVEQYQLYLIQFILVISLAIIILFLLKLNRSVKFERRIGKYAIDPIINKEESFVEKLEKKYLNFIKKLRPLFEKLIIFNNYSKKYNKYIKYSNQLSVIPLDFIINKVVIGLILLLLYVFSEVARNKMPEPFAVFFAFAFGFMLLDIYLKYNETIKKRQIENDILKAVIIMNNAFKSGKSTLQAVEMTTNQLPKPTNEEFHKIFVDLNFGMKVDDAFNRFAARVDVEEVRYITSSLTILNKTGGNIVNVFNSIEKSLFDKKKLKEELKSLTVSSKLVIKSLLLIPFIVIGIILLLNPTYFSPLFKMVLINGEKFPLGYVLIGSMAILFSIYVYLLNKIIRISV